MPTTRFLTTARRHLSRPVRVLSVSAAGAALCLGAFVAPAQAESATVNDPAGNHSPPYLDITTVKYNNGLHRVVGIIHGVNLRKDSTYVQLTLKARDGSGVSYAAATYGKLGKPGYVKELFRYNRAGTTSTRLHCGMKANWHPALDYVVITVPQRCLGAHKGRLTMHAALEQSYSEPGAGERAAARTLNRGEPM